MIIEKLSIMFEQPCIGVEHNWIGRVFHDVQTVEGQAVGSFQLVRVSAFEKGTQGGKEFPQKLL